jgi:hypothetical protein
MMTCTVRRAVGGLLLGTALAGCGGMASRSGQPAPPPVNLSGYSAAFKQGYTDGCASVQRQRRDENRYKTETDYTMGWNDGYSVCGKKR